MSHTRMIAEMHLRGDTPHPQRLNLDKPVSTFLPNGVENFAKRQNLLNFFSNSALFS